jgi:hypothetical protein
MCFACIVEYIKSYCNCLKFLIAAYENEVEIEVFRAVTAE